MALCLSRTEKSKVLANNNSHKILIYKITAKYFYTKTKIKIVYPLVTAMIKSYLINLKIQNNQPNYNT